MLEIVGNAHLVQSLRQILCPILMGNIPIGRVVLEELTFAFPSIAHALPRVNVLLTATDDTDETEFKGVDTTS